MKNLSLSEKLAISWITFLKENNIEMTDKVGFMFKSKFFDIQKGFLFEHDLTKVDEVALAELQREIKGRLSLQ